MNFIAALISIILLITTTLSSVSPSPVSRSTYSAGQLPRPVAKERRVKDSISYESLPPGRGTIHPWTTSSSTVQSIPATSTKVTYTSFNGQTYQLNAFKGLYTQTLLPDSWLNENTISSAELLRLLDSADLTYAVYKELTGTEPKGDGLLTIAYIPLQSQDAYGWGLVGYKGIEIDDSLATLSKIKEELKSSSTFSGIDHEAAHNWDTSSRFATRSPADSHAWTSLLQASAKLITRKIENGVTSEEALKLKLRPLDHYISNGALNWSNAFASPTIDMLPNQLWSGTVLRLLQLEGIPFLKRYAAALNEISAGNPLPTDQNRLDEYHIRAIGAGLNSNPECVAARFKINLSDEERSYLRTRYNTTPPRICQDADSDTFTPLDGDTDDHDPLVNPKATESINQKDDDSNSVTDDVAVTEQNLGGADITDALQSAPTLNFGSRLQGTISTPDDVDTVRVAVPATPDTAYRYLSINARTQSPDTEIQIELLYPTGTSTNIFIYAGESRYPQRTYIKAAAGQTLILRIRRSSANAFTNPFSYEAGLSNAEAFLPNNPTQLTNNQPPATSADGARILTTSWSNQDWQELERQGATHIRWWITNQGWVTEQPILQSNQLIWKPPQSSSQATYGYRVQAIRRSATDSSGTTLTRISQPALFVEPASGPITQPPAGTEPTPLEPQATPTPTPTPQAPIPTTVRPAPEATSPNQSCIAPSLITRIAFTDATAVPVTLTAAPASAYTEGETRYPTNLQGWTITFAGIEGEPLSVRQAGLDPNTAQPRIEMQAVVPDSLPTASNLMLVVKQQDRIVTSFTVCTEPIAPALWTDAEGFAVAFTSPENQLISQSSPLKLNGYSLLSNLNTGRMITLFGTGFRHAPDTTTTNNPAGIVNVAESFSPATLLYTDGTNRKLSAAMNYTGPARSGPHGLDQLILTIPMEAAGAGVVELHITTYPTSASLPVDVKVRLKID